MIISRDILESRVQAPLRVISVRMAGPDASLQLVFGKAFLVELQRGNLESAKLFARAFLVRTRLMAGYPPPASPAACDRSPSPTSPPAPRPPPSAPRPRPRTRRAASGRRSPRAPPV